MTTRKQIEKQYAAELEKSSAPKGLVQALYALSNDPTLQGADLIKYDGYRGKKPSGTQISLAKRLLGIKTGPAKRAKKAGSKRGRPRKTQVSKSADASALLMEAVQSLKEVVASADKERALAEKEYQERIKEIEQDSAEARRKLKKIEPLLASL